MRGEFEVPAEKGYVVGDLLVNGRPLKYGAQLAGTLVEMRSPTKLTVSQIISTFLSLLEPANGMVKRSLDFAVSHHRPR